ncbi:YceD family protein [Szabonella alba]|uniref:DUF177 domain-containing protein n=1 Tax=Szabonella alba TaxID=2804194 RepID=A0A8K0Y152_9RHOB|nr:DUF177 domain-containing protein [Szabonella alba]MBL4917793.1 DUF177 domain-containing protein [Szabonella alba]
MTARPESRRAPKSRGATAGKAAAVPEAPFPAPYRVPALPTRKPLRFDLRLDAKGREAMMAELGLTALPRLHLKGEIRPVGRGDFELVAQLEALAVQPCAVTLAPVETRVSEPVLRRYVEGMLWPEAEEAEMPGDDSAEPMPDRIDLREIATEALVLALPDYPRAEGVELGEAVFAADGAEPLRDADLKPFAALSSLRDSLTGAAPGEAETGDDGPGKGGRKDGAGKA